MSCEMRGARKSGVSCTALGVRLARSLRGLIGYTRRHFIYSTVRTHVYCVNMILSLDRLRVSLKTVIGSPPIRVLIGAARVYEVPCCRRHKPPVNDFVGPCSRHPPPLPLSCTPRKSLASKAYVLCFALRNSNLIP